MTRWKLLLHGASAVSQPRLAAALLACLAIPIHTASAQQRAPANDFPTIERVQFVEACARDHPDRPHTELLYKCSCMIDAMASELSFEEYVNASTAFYASQVAGERGAGIRDNSAGKALAERFRTARARAAGQCLLPP